MSDRLLRDLGDVARSEAKLEEARFGDRWDRLAAGTLTAEEEAELKALAESSPEHREAYEAFRPLGTDFQARVASAIQAERARETPRTAPPEPRPRVLPFRRAVRRVEVWVGTAAAVAAGVFFLVRMPASLPPLPDYAVDPIVGNQTVRGGMPSPANGTPVFGPGSEMTVIVRPPHSVTTPVEAKAFLTQGRELFPWQGGEISKDGNVRFRGVLSGFRPGKWKVLIVVGRPERLPSPSELQSELHAGLTRTPDWQAFSQAVEISGARASP